jgi:hypothetical protein
MVSRAARVRWIAMVRTSVQIGVVALSTAATLLGTVRSPQAKKVKGRALLNSATVNSQGSRRRGGSCLPLRRSTVQSRTAPSVQRNSATQSGGKELPAIRIMRKETPHNAESRRI